MTDRAAPEVFQKQIGQNVSLSGMVAEEPVEKENGVELTVEAEEGGTKTKILLFVRENKGYRYGDMLFLRGKLEEPKAFLTDQGKEFDYVNYLKKDGIFFVMRSPKIEVASRGGGAFLKRTLFSFEAKLSGKLDAALPNPESLMMRALILGERASFSESLRQAFVTTGLIHVVTISGYHVALVAEWIMKILGFLPMSFAAAAGIFAIFLYVVMTGGAQTAIRAGLMAAVALLAQTTGKRYEVGRALVLTGTLMILVNPLILVFDVSFELSFLATIAVVFLTPRVERYFLWIQWKRLRDIVALTTAAYVFVLPFILYKIGNFSLVALPANLAVLPFIPATMILGFATGFAGLVANTLARFPGAIAYLLLRYELAAIGFFSHLSFASFSVPNFPLILTLLIYAVFLYYFFVHVLSGTAFALLRRWGKKVGQEADPHFLLPIGAFLVTLLAAGFLSYRHHELNQTAQQKLQALLVGAPAEESSRPFAADLRTKSVGCRVKGSLPDHECTPGAVFKDVTVDQICVRGYTQTVRNVSTKARKEVYAEYNVPYPQPRGAYEVDHLIPLALGGSNDIANLWTEAAEATPGFHEKDLVEIYLQGEVCSHRVALPVAERQIAADWLAVYNNLPPEEIAALKKKYGGR